MIPVVSSKKRRAFGEQFPGPRAHYALRDRYGNNQTVCRVRRSSDNAETDVTSSQVWAWLVSWVGVGNDGFVVTQYDLTGNGNHITQATSTDQPKIVSSGVLVTENGLPSIEFGSTSESKYLSSTVATSVYVATVFFVMVSDQATYSGSGGAARFVNLSFNGTDNRLYLGVGTSYSSNQLGAAFGGLPLHNASIDAPTVLTSVSVFASPTSGEVLINDSLALSVTPNEGGAGISTMQIRIGGDGNGYLDGRVSEVIAYTSDQSANRAAINARLASDYAIA